MDQNDYYTCMNNNKNYDDKILDLLFNESVKNNKDDYINFSNKYDKDSLKEDKHKLMENHIMEMHNIVFKFIKNNNHVNTNNSKLLLELKNEINMYSLKVTKLD